MKWFKFYGQDYISDPKILSLTSSERSCWITLLSYGSVNDNGMITFLSEEQLMIQAGVSPLHEEWDKTKGVLKKLENLEMITDDNGVITIKNWIKRQETSLTSYERVKRNRQKKRNDNAMITLEENRIEENRIYKKRIYKKRNTNKKKVIGDQEIAKTENEVKKFSPEGAEVIKMFEVVNPSYEKMYSNKTQRAAADRLLKKWTLEQIRSVVGILPKLNASKYAKGKSITPLQLEDNLGYIKAFIDQNNSQKIRRYEESDK